MCLSPTCLRRFCTVLGSLDSNSMNIMTIKVNWRINIPVTCKIKFELSKTVLNFVVVVVLSTNKIIQIAIIGVFYDRDG